MDETYNWMGVDKLFGSPGTSILVWCAFVDKKISTLSLADKNKVVISYSFQLLEKAKTFLPHFLQKLSVYSEVMPAYVVFKSQKNATIILHPFTILQYVESMKYFNI